MIVENNQNHEMARAFIGIPVDEQIKLELITNVSQFNLSGRIVPKEYLHITLFFIGNIKISIIPQLIQNLSKIPPNLHPFQAEVYGLGAFPSIAQARVIWAGIRDGSEMMIKLYQLVLDQIKVTGIFVKEKENFYPHITLMRRKKPEQLLFSSEHLDLTTRHWTINSFNLYRSHLTQKGAFYEIIHSFSLE